MQVEGRLAALESQLQQLLAQSANLGAESASAAPRHAEVSGIKAKSSELDNLSPGHRKAEAQVSGNPQNRSEATLPTSKLKDLCREDSEQKLDNKDNRK